MTGPQQRSELRTEGTLLAAVQLQVISCDARDNIPGTAQHTVSPNAAVLHCASASLSQVWPRPWQVNKCAQGIYYYNEAAQLAMECKQGCIASSPCSCCHICSWDAGGWGFVAMRGKNKDASPRADVYLRGSCIFANYHSHCPSTPLAICAPQLPKYMIIRSFGPLGGPFLLVMASPEHV